MRILAVDYGDARTGLAISDATELLATPLVPQIEEKSLPKAALAVAEAAKKAGAEAIVIGLPKNMDGTEGPRAEKTRKFAAKVAEYTGLAPAFWDERRTTVTAAAILGENAVFGKKRKQRLDSVSAAVILEAYLAWRRLHPGEEA